MKASLLSLAMLCAFGVQADVEVEPNFDIAKFAGKWHVPALASNDEMFKSLKEIIKTPAARIILLPNGNVEMETYYLMGENCEKMDSIYMKTGQPGHFVVTDANGRKDMWVVASDNANFAILYVERQLKGMPPSKALQLYTRVQEPGENLANFKNYCKKMGLLGELLLPPPSDKCFKELSG